MLHNSYIELLRTNCIIKNRDSMKTENEKSALEQVQKLSKFETVIYSNDIIRGFGMVVNPNDYAFYRTNGFVNRGGKVTHLRTVEIRSYASKGENRKEWVKKLTVIGEGTWVVGPKIPLTTSILKGETGEKAMVGFQILYYVSEKDILSLQQNHENLSIASTEQREIPLEDAKRLAKVTLGFYWEPQRKIRG